MVGGNYITLKAAPAFKECLSMKNLLTILYVGKLKSSTFYKNVEMALELVLSCEAIPCKPNRELIENFQSSHLQQVHETN